MATRTEHDPSLFRAIHHLRAGGLHRALNVDPGDKIPKEKLEAARHSGSPHVKAMANFAHTLAGFHKK